MNQIANYLQLSTGIVWVIALVTLALGVGSAVRVAAARRTPEGSESRFASLKSWWLLWGCCAVAALCGPAGILAAAGLVSLLALHEYFRLLWGDELPGWLRGALMAVAVAQYLLIHLRLRSGFLLLVPLGLLLLLPAQAIVRGQSKGFVGQVTALQWGMMLLVFAFSHVAAWPLQPHVESGSAAVGAFLFVVLVTEINDISQALIGRQIGSRKITPVVSPNKTWEGFLGGVVVSALVAALLGGFLLPWFAPLFQKGSPMVNQHPWWWLPAAGVLIAVAGFCGDLTISAVKRDQGVKDSGTLLPGQGGILDRIDSLIFSAPVFFYFIWWLNR